MGWKKSFRLRCDIYNDILQVNGTESRGLTRMKYNRQQHAYLELHEITCLSPLAFVLGIATETRAGWRSSKPEKKRNRDKTIRIHTITLSSVEMTSLGLQAMVSITTTMLKEWGRRPANQECRIRKILCRWYVFSPSLKMRTFKNTEMNLLHYWTNERSVVYSLRKIRLPASKSSTSDQLCDNLEEDQHRFGHDGDSQAQKEFASRS